MKIAKYLFTIIVPFLIVILLISSCNNKPKRVKGLIDTPKKLLLKIYQLDQEKDYETLKKYIFDIKFHMTTNKGEKKVIDSQELIINGIKKKKIVGSFAYNPKVLLKHAKIINKHTIPASRYLIDKYLIGNGIAKNSEYLTKIIKETPEALLFYVNKTTRLIFLKTNGELQLVYTEDLTIFNKYSIKNQKLYYVAEEKKVNTDK